LASPSLAALPSYIQQPGLHRISQPLSTAAQPSAAFQPHLLTPLWPTFLVQPKTHLVCMSLIVPWGAKQGPLILVLEALSSMSPSKTSFGRMEEFVTSVSLLMTSHPSLVIASYEPPLLFST